MVKPLEGVRIVDFSNMLMAPYATQMLGDLGADVIKVEAPEGDPVRNITPARHPGMGSIFLSVNRSKRSVVLDLKTEHGHAAMINLIRDADVLVYNRRPQVMERLGLSYDKASFANERIIYAGIFGYGQQGPYAHKPAFDDLIQGAVAIPSLVQRADGRPPVYAPTAIVDRGVALWAVGQINAALYRQARSGLGQRIDMPMFEMMTSFVLSDHLAGRAFEPPIGQMGYARMLSPDRRPYPTSDGYLCAMIYTDRHWQAFFEVIGRPNGARTDARYADMASRTRNIDAIYGELAELLATRTTAEWLELFDRADIPAMPLHTLETLLEDPHLEAVDFFRLVEHPSEGTLRDMAVPSTWSETQPAPGRHAPRLGEHSVEVLREAGVSQSEIDDMLRDGITVQAGEI